MPKMAVDSDHTPFVNDSGRVGRLCRELEIAGIEAVLSVNHDGALASGVSLSVDATATCESASAAAQVRDQAFDVLVSGLPLSVSMSRLGPDAVDVFSAICELLRSAAQDAGAAPGSVEITIEAKSLSPQAAWLTRCRHLNEGPLYVLPDCSLMRPDKTLLQRDRHKRFWMQLWHLRMTGMVRVACAPFVAAQCPLLSLELAQGVVPSVAIQASVGSAWVPMRVDISRFTDDSGSLHETALEEALCRAVEIGDELHGLVAWPTAQMRHDAWLNRRLAVTLTGFGDLALKRKLDPTQFTALEHLCDVVRWAQDVLHRESRRIATRTGCLPALEQGDPSRALPGGEIRNGWHKRWREAVELVAIRHRNLLVLSPWSVFPTKQPADYRYADLLPLLGFANACTFSRPPSASNWSVEMFKSFHQRAWAVLQQRDVAHQIAERI